MHVENTMVTEDGTKVTSHRTSFGVRRDPRVNIATFVFLVDGQ
jgi:hypothetical protein